VNAAAKLLEAMRRSALDWSLGDLQAIARSRGVSWRHKGGSHCIFVRADGRTLSVPAKRPIKPVSIRMFLALVDGE
jgi:predicted RNA binding protein YcfA (HicA-like mRNA interferase family)